MNDEFPHAWAAGWWQQLGLSRPRALWLGRVERLRVECRVVIETASPAPPHLWAALASLPTTANALNRKLPGAGRWLRQLRDAGLASEHAGQWQRTPAGELLRAEPLRHWRELAGRAFDFVRTASGRWQFTAWTRPPTGERIAATFDPQWITEAIREASAWKGTWHFPADVVGVADSVARLSASRESVLAVDWGDGPLWLFAPAERLTEHPQMRWPGTAAELGIGFGGAWVEINR